MQHVPTPGRIQLPLSKIKRRTISCIRNFVGKDSIRSLLHALEEEEERSFSVGDSYEFMRGHDHPHAQVREARKVTRGTTSGRMILLREETGRAHLFARGNSFTQRFARPGLSRRTTLRTALSIDLFGSSWVIIAAEEGGEGNTRMFVPFKDGFLAKPSAKRLPVPSIRSSSSFETTRKERGKKKKKERKKNTLIRTNHSFCASISSRSKGRRSVEGIFGTCLLSRRSRSPPLEGRESNTYANRFELEQ